MEAVVDQFVAPMAMLGVVKERSSTPMEAQQLYGEGMELVRTVHAHAHGWVGDEATFGLQPRGTAWTQRALTLAMRYQDDQDPAIFKGNPRLMEMRDVVLAEIAEGVTS
jgi:hypothetical protein